MRERWYRGEGADEWASGKSDDGGKKGGKRGSKGSTPDWYGDRQGSSGNKSQRQKVEARATLDIAAIGEGKGTFGVKCPHKWTNSTDEEDDEGSSW